MLTIYIVLNINISWKKIMCIPLKKLTLFLFTNEGYRVQAFLFHISYFENNNTK